MQRSGQKTAAAGSGSDGRRPSVIAGAICDRGLNPRRPVNQDRYLAISEAGLFAVFDGVGGRKAGEVASQTAADTVEEAFAGEPGAVSAELIRRAIQIANRDIYEMGQEEPAYGSMATTVALVHLFGNKANIAHVGDSRVYRLSSGTLLRETIDHTDFDDQIRAGLVSSKDARPKEDSHSINRALGVDTDVDFEMKTVEVRDGDRFLLCTDGVYRHLDDDELAQVLQREQDPQEATDEIRRLVLERGADDNLTAVVVQVGGSLSTDSRHSRSNPEMMSRSSRESGEGTTDRLGRYPARSSKSEYRGAGANKDRIHVHFGPDEASGASEDDDDANEGTGGDEDTGLRRSNVLIYSLLVLVLVFAAFYGGLRSSSLLNKKRSGAQPAEAQLDQARQSYDRGEFMQADQVLSTLVATEPQNSQAWYWLGKTQLQERRYAESVRSLERATEQAPEITDAYVQAAAAFEAMGNRAKALEMLSRYAEASRKHTDPVR